MITEQQRAERRTGVGGSDIAALFGLSPYKTAYELYLEKLGVDEPEVETLEDYIRKERGNYLEAFVCHIYEKKTGNKFKAKGDVPTKTHPQYPYMRANVDGILENGALFEAKTCSIFAMKDWGVQGTGQIPKQHVLQVAYYAFIYDAPYVDVEVLSESGCFSYRYTRHPQLEELIKNKVIDFWENHVLKEIPPVAMAVSDINHMYPETVADSAKVIIDEIKFHWEIYLQTKERMKELEKEAEKSKIEIMKFMEDSEYLVDSRQHRLASFKYMCGRANLAIQKLKTEEPEIYHKYATIGKPIRTFRIIEKE